MKPQACIPELPVEGRLPAPIQETYIGLNFYYVKTLTLWVLFVTTAMITITKAGVHFPESGRF